MMTGWYNVTQPVLLPTRVFIAEFFGLRKHSEITECSIMYTPQGLYGYAPVVRRRSRSRSRKPSRSLVADMLSVPTGVGLKSPQSFTRTVTKGKKSIEPAPISSQHDTHTRYRYHRQPRRKRARYVKQVNLFRHLMSKNQPLQTYTVKKTANASASVDSQITFGVMLYTTQVASPENDIQQLFYDAYSVASLSTIDQKRLVVKSAVLDVQLSNAATQTCIIDVFRIRLRNVWNTNDNLFTIWQTTFNDQNTISTKSNGDPSVTPFQNPSFCKFFKILDKREIMLGAGLTTTIQLRKPGNRQVQGRRVANEPFGLRGLCEGYLFQIRGTPVTNSGPLYQLAAVNVTWSYQKTYNYALPVGADASEAIHDA